MYKFFKYLALGSISASGACLPQYPAIQVVAPQGKVPSCQGATYSLMDPDVVTLVATSPIEDGVTQEVLIFRGYHSDQDLIVPVGNERRISVEPMCGFTLKSGFSPLSAIVRPIGGLETGGQYTILVLSTAKSQGLMDVWTTTVRMYNNPRGQQMYLPDGTRTLVNYQIQLPRVSIPLRPMRFKIHLNIG